MNIARCYLLSTLLIALPVGAFAQGEESEPTSVTVATMAVSDAKGASHTYTITDFSVAASNNYYGYTQQASLDVSLNVNLPTPPDAAMLQWMKSTAGPEGSRNIVITVNTTDPDGKTSEMKYAADAARVTSFSASYSGYAAYFSLQIAPNGLTINDVKLEAGGPY